MRYVHFSDTHLGRSNFKLPERIEDFKKVFKEVIDFCIENKVDFVVHSGDLFDNARPNTSILLFAIEQLKRLKENQIPLFIVAGSHDVGVEGTLITILERVGLLKNLGSSRYFEQTEEGIILNGEKFNGVFIAGFPGRRANIKEILEKISPNFPNGNCYKIFLFHHIVTDISPLFGDFPLSLLPKGFDYYAGGHWHLRKEIKYNNKPVNYPGSTEYCGIDEMSHERGFYFIQDNETKYIKLNPRKVIIKDINANNLTPEEATEKCLLSIDESSENPILILKISGRLSKGKRIEINKNLIQEHGGKKGYLFVKLIVSDLLNPEDFEKTQLKSKTLDEIENEYLQSKGYSNKEVKIAKKLIENLGEKLTQNETEEKIKNLIKKLVD